MSVNLISSICLGLLISGMLVLGLQFAAAAMIVVALILLGVGLIRAKLIAPGAFGYWLMALWLFAGLVELWMWRLEALLLSFLLPFVVVLGLRWAMRAIMLSSKVPLFIPVALVIVLLPLLTEDPWRLAAVAGTQMLLLAGISILPLTLLLVYRLLRMKMEPVLQEAINQVRARNDRADETFRTLKQYRQTSDGQLEEDVAKAMLNTSYRLLDSASHLNQAIDVAPRGIRWRGVRRLLSLILGIVLAVWVMIYLLAVAAMPRSLAAEWSKQAVHSWEIDMLGFHMALPLGPYVAVASLFAIVACVGFLGFALTEDQYSDALWRAVVRVPCEWYVLLALPYLAFIELDKSKGAPEKSRGGKDTRAKQRSR